MITDALDVARAHMRAFNRRERDALVAAYHPDAVAELFTLAPAGDGGVALPQDDVVWTGREAIAGALDAFLAAYEGGLAGGSIFDVRTIARIETGWTHVEWAARLRPRQAALEVLSYAGYFHLKIRDGLIVEQRTVAHVALAMPAGSDASVAAGSSGAPRGLGSLATAVGAAVPATLEGTSGEGPPRSPRIYPSRPIVGVGAVVIDSDGLVVLIKRKYEPLAGQWSLPGGSLEVGETLEAGVARELLEETGLVVDVGPVVDVFDRILLDAEGRVRYHFVLIDYLCTPRGGELRAASDVTDVRLAHPDRLAEFRLTPKAEDVIRKVVAQWKAGLLAPPEKVHRHAE
jgi:ADP-ribose pyrophosphatase YjhB (NUDIX family)